MGYVGLPHARLFASRGFRVIGVDADPAKVRALRAGRSYVGSVRPSELRRNFTATTDVAALAEADAIILCVPTPLADDGTPDLSFVRDTARAVGRVMRAGALVVLESTTYPGTTREIVKPELDQAGRPYLLAYAPERDDPGNRDFKPADIPKVVGGIDPASRDAAVALYRRVVKRVVPVSSLEVAEAAKILENVYRAVNIALVNELKMCFERMGLDIWEVLDAASTKPFGFQRFNPGPGMGGHCIPVDPFYLTWRASRFGFRTEFIGLAGVINQRMPGYVIGRLRHALGRPLKGARVLVLGLAYKKDTDDPRESPAWTILDLLATNGALASWHDPHIRRLPATRRWSHLRLPRVEPSPAALRACDAVVLVTDHSAYDYARIARHARLVVDTRNAFRGIAGPVTKA